MEKMKVFLLPYAGASSLAYYKWRTSFPPGYEPHFIELKGRGEKMGEPFYQDMAEAVEDISAQIMEKTKADEYCIFGHSMGALLAYETYYRLYEKGAKLPRHMFFSGRKAPQIEVEDYKEYDRDDEHFIQMVSRFGGLTGDFFDEGIKQVFLPILRADFKILGEYIFQSKGRAISCGMTVLYGNQDRSAIWPEIEAWKIHAGKGCSFREFDGNHFFLNDKYPEIVQMIVDAA